MQAYLYTDMDRDAHVAAAGTVCEPLLAALLEDPFFGQPIPKTTGPELFNMQYLNRAQQRVAVAHISPEDTMATLCAFSAQGIIRSVRALAATGRVVMYVSGGGLHNPLLMQ